MEHNSLNSSFGKSIVSSSENSSCPEDSGWTYYLEDFSKGIIEPSNCSSLGGSSLVSDAASRAAWKFSHLNQDENHNHVVSCFSVIKVSSKSNNLPKKLSFKKTRTKQLSEDDPLEDTASSPVNSPKGGDLSHTEIISRKIDDSMGKKHASENHSE